MSVLYNENESFAAQWLRNLIDAGHLARGRVDDRDIRCLEPGDVAGGGQRHFFSGIGIWQHALRLAGIADGADVWTGSCPCQPFSVAGAKRQHDDERHLWPAWFNLIRECRPPVIFGEQVAGTSGRAWLDAVFLDLEAEGYRCAGADLCAASIGAPHKRQRFFWVANLHGGGLERVSAEDRDEHQDARRHVVDRCGETNSMGDTDEGGGGWGADVTRRSPQRRASSRRSGVSVSMGDADGETWSDPRWVFCDDPGGARWRPVEAGTFPLAPRNPGDVGRLRAYGNAIVAPLAAAFIEASLLALEDER